MTTIAPTPAPLWNPPRQLLSQARLKQYIDWLFVKKGLYFRNYNDLWDWSVTDPDHFWESICQFFEVQFTTPYRYILQRADDGGLTGASWFGGATLNYAEQVFRQQTPGRPALLFAAEHQPLRQLSWRDLTAQVAAVSAFLRARGIGVGDRVVAMLPNCPEAVVAFLAANALGAVWSACAPDLPAPGVLARFQLLEPKVLLTVNGYTHTGQFINQTATVQELRESLPTLTTTIGITHSGRHPSLADGYPADITWWADIVDTHAPDGLLFEPVAFDHPLWILYSPDDTTGKLRAIAHPTGGCLLEHIKLLALHQDVRPGERYFGYSTTEGLMWNKALSSLLVGATMVLYEGAPAYPSLHRLWELIDRVQVNHFSGETAYLLACMRSGIRPVNDCQLGALRSISPTGDVLPAEGFRWVYDAVKADIWLLLFISDADTGTSLAGGNPLLPVYAGEVQGRLLGCKIDVFDEAAQPVGEQPGELVLLGPMPSLPLSDPDTPRDPHSTGWRSGHWVRFTNRHTVISYGQAGATLNRDGYRIGTADVYAFLGQVPAVADSLMVGVEQPGGTCLFLLFVVLQAGVRLDSTLTSTIRQAIQNRFGLRYSPDKIIRADQIPYTLGGQKLEVPIRKLLTGTDVSLVISRHSLRNPAALDHFIDLIGGLTARW